MNRYLSKKYMQPVIQEIEQGLKEKYANLCETLRDRLADGLIVAFSGGVDSAFLLWAAETERRATGGKLAAFTTISESLAETEERDARAFAKSLGVEHILQKSNELSNPDYIANDGSRCYHCKTTLFNLCTQVSKQSGLKWIAYGYNASDRSDFRPGHKAALEHNVLSPLDDVGLTKDEIRALMRVNGLEMAEKPASPCLSSRLMTGVLVTPQKLKDVEEMETILRKGGLKIFRVRLHDDGKRKFLRLEVSQEEMQLAFEMRELLVREGQARGYQWVTLDLAGYRTGGAN